jgi:cell division protein FtsL
MDMPHHLEQNTAAHLTLFSKHQTARGRNQRCYWTTLMVLFAALALLLLYGHTRVAQQQTEIDHLLDTVKLLNNELAHQNIRMENLASQLNSLASEINGLKPTESYFTTIVKKILQKFFSAFFPAYLLE